MRRGGRCGARPKSSHPRANMSRGKVTALSKSRCYRRPDGSYVGIPIEMSAGGSIDFYFCRWRISYSADVFAHEFLPRSADGLCPNATELGEETENEHEVGAVGLLKNKLCKPITMERLRDGAVGLTGPKRRYRRMAAANQRLASPSENTKGVFRKSLCLLRRAQPHATKELRNLNRAPIHGRFSGLDRRAQISA